MDPAAGDSLLCCENGALGAERLCKAYRDPALLQDRRVLTNLLGAESRYVPSDSCFQCVQSEIKVPMRRVLAYWMVEVCEEHGCQDDVFPLSMNMVDRFLSVTPVKKDQLQLLGAVCLFISSKLRESRPLTARVLVQCADHSFTQQDVTVSPALWLVRPRCRWPFARGDARRIRRLPTFSAPSSNTAARRAHRAARSACSGERAGTAARRRSGRVPDERRTMDWELLVLDVLRWEVSAVTSHDFLEPLLQRLPLGLYLTPASEVDVRRQAQTYIIMCVTEHRFTPYPASTVAASSIAAAVRGAASPPTAAAASAECLARLQQVTAVETGQLQRCLDDIEDTIRAFAAEQTSRSERSPSTGMPPGDLAADYGDAGTPTDVLEVHF